MTKQLHAPLAILTALLFSRCAAIVATIVTSILAFSSPSIAASEEELGHLGRQCLTFRKSRTVCFKSV
jgi:hypothetical protein